MNWLEGLIYGIVSGLTEFLPISSQAHQRILLKMFGMDAPDPLQDLIIHLALLASVLIGCRNSINQLRRGYQLQRNNRQGIRNNSYSLELRFLKNAAFPLIIVYIIAVKLIPINYNLLWVALFSLISALLLFISSRTMYGNRDEKAMSSFDSILVGAVGALSAFSGISRIGSMLAVMNLRGVDRRKALNWVLLLSIPALLLLAFIDILSLLTTSGRSQICGSFPGYLLSAAGAYIAGYAGIFLLRSASAQNDTSGSAYYALGVSLFSLFLYLTVV